ncbi:hypothetical protein D3C76_1459870 [compost metagenome]
MTSTLAAQGAAKSVICFGSLRRRGNLRAQFAGGEAAVQFTSLHQFQQHQRIARALLNHKVTGGGHPGKLRPTLRCPGGEAMIIIQSGNRGTERLFGTGDKRQQNGGQFGKRGEAHGLSLIGVQRAACSGFRKPTT